MIKLSVLFVKSNFKCTTKHEMLVLIDHVKENINNKKFELVDARSKGRFDGIENEPRPDIKSGSIPKSWRFAQARWAG